MTKVLQHLTLAEVQAKAMEFYKAGKLTAQHPVPSYRMCVNKGKGGHRCAVATAFNDQVLDMYPRGGIGGIIESGRVTADDAKAIQRIQQAHDDWATSSQSRGVLDVRTRARKGYFLSLIAPDEPKAN